MIQRGVSNRNGKRMRCHQISLSRFSCCIHWSVHEGSLSINLLKNSTYTYWLASELFRGIRSPQHLRQAPTNYRSCSWSCRWLAEAWQVFFLSCCRSVRSGELISYIHLHHWSPHQVPTNNNSTSFFLRVNEPNWRHRDSAFSLWRRRGFPNQTPLWVWEQAFYHNLSSPNKM